MNIDEIFTGYKQGGNHYIGTPEKAKSIPAQLVSGMRRR
jgi:hypothetical protein